MKISPWRVCAATSCCWEIIPGGFAACRPAPCWWKTPRERLPTCRSGGARLLRGLPNFRSTSPNCGSKSARVLTAFPIVHRTQPQSTGLSQECGLDQSGAEQIVEYILAGRAVLGAVPTQQTIIAERFFDESGGMQLVIHAPFGGRINKAWGLALRKRFCRSFNFELQAAATDNGLNISLSEQHSFPLADVFHFLHTRKRRATARAGRARFSDLRDALALGGRALARAVAIHGREESAAADSAHEVGRFARRRFSPGAGVPGKYHRRNRRFPIIRWCAKR